MKQNITVREFTEMLWEGLAAVKGGTVRKILQEYDDNQMEAAGRRGWLETQDIYSADERLERRRAAAVIHAFLKKELGEADEATWQNAGKLKDLYDCRTCVNHVAQVYEKGIMGAEPVNPLRADEGFFFGMRKQVTIVEATAIMQRIFKAEKRLTVAAVSGAQKCDAVEGSEATAGCEATEVSNAAKESNVQAETKITLSEAMALLASDSSVKLVDVSSAEEFSRSHPAGAINIPLMKLLENPEMLSEYKEGPIIFYCHGGYRSEAAAKCLQEAGYQAVMHCSREENERLVLVP